MNLAQLGQTYDALPPGEQALFAEAVRRLLSDGFLWREEETDRRAYNLLARRSELVAAYLEVTGWKLRYDEAARIYTLAHVEGAHRRRFGKKTTVWLLVLRLIYAEKRERPEAALTRYPTVSVGDVIERYAAFFPNQRVREKTSLDEALRALQAARLIRAGGGGALRASQPEKLIELLPALEVIIPPQDIVALAERLQEYAHPAADEADADGE
jgi:hypothetical protein